MPLTWPQAIGRRLARHHLLNSANAPTLVKVASDICGAHAQVAASAELMLGVRLPGITRRDVRTAVWESRTLIKTVGLRGTLHLLPAEEVPKWMAANRLRFPAERRRLARAGIDPDQLDRVIYAIGEIVGSEPIGRPDLERALQERVGGWAIATNQGWVGSYRNWPMAMGFAAAQGLVCYGPGRGGRSTFVRLSDWSGWREEDPLAGGVFALRRFLAAYGPSTRAEFSRWFALEPAVATRVFGAAADEVDEVEVEGERRWILRSDLDEWAEAPGDTVHLLPHFDVYVVGSHPRNQLMQPGSRVARASPGTAANLAVVLVGGRVAGVWERRPKGKRLLIKVDAHVPLNRRQRVSIEEQGERIANILERESELEFGDVPLRFHL